jgi:fructoselysine/glucoselysine PTS system EIIA component
MEQNITRKFLIATHGQFARGVKSSLEIIIGQTENLFLIEAYVEENKGIESEMEAILKNMGEHDELIVFTDLLGGSITNQVLRFTQGVPGSKQGVPGSKQGVPGSKQGVPGSTQGRNVHVISGFNLALLIEVLMADTGMAAPEVIESAIANAREQMAYVNKLMTSHNDDQVNEN